MDNLIICEFCGTSYNPAEGCCPVCQSRPDHSENYMGDHYDYDERPQEDDAPASARTGGKILILILLLALLAGFTGYILYSFELLPFLKPAAAEQSTADIPCTQLAVDASELTLHEVGETVQVQTVVQPSDTTQRLTYSVDSPTIAGVTQDGVVTAKSAGEAIITITCGSFTAYCNVICDFGEETPAPVTPEPSVEPTPGVAPNPTPEYEVDPGQDAALHISSEDITFFAKGENTTLTLSGGSGDGESAEWTSSDETIATVDQSGHVEAVGEGTATIYAVIGTERVSCIVRCRFS